jgi:DNA invertase Pin-like site-specific DNA recombinase
MKTVTKLETVPKIRRRKRVAAYARVSYGKDAMRHSLSAQISYYSALIQRHIEWEFVGVYADDPVSGTKNNRAEFQRLLADCRAGKIDTVITKSVTRFARNTLTTLEAVRELKNLGVDVFFEKENIHSMSGDGELMLTILASYAQEESRSVSENCKWRIRKMFKEGHATFFRIFGYRFKDGNLRVVPEEAEIVRQIFADFLAGMGKIAIAKKLNAQGIATMLGGPWWENTIYNILRNEKYIGDMILQKTYYQDPITKKKRINRGELPQYHVKDSHEPIISRETFGRVQQELTARAAQYVQPNNTPVTCPFSNKIVCEKCGRHYHRKHTAAGTKYEKIVWICHTFNTLGKSACNSQQIPEYILYAKIAEIFGIQSFDEDRFNAEIAEIRIPSHNKLVLVFSDGRRAETDWQSPSRRESWTAEMKQTARERQNRIWEERRAKHEQ